MVRLKEEHEVFQASTSAMVGSGTTNVVTTGNGTNTYDLELSRDPVRAVAPPGGVDLRSEELLPVLSRSVIRRRPIHTQRKNIFIFLVLTIQNIQNSIDIRRERFIPSFIHWSPDCNG